MDRVFVDSIDPCELVQAWSAYCDDTQLHAVLAQAALNARHSGRPALASLVLPVPESDPLLVFRAFQLLTPGQCFYWEQPSRHIALIGSGQATSIQVAETDPFVQASQHWQELMTTATVSRTGSDLLTSDHAPVLFGGFRFDPLRPYTSPVWQHFPAGLLVLPELLFSIRSQQVTLTLSRMVRADEDLAALTRTIIRQVEQVAHTLALLPPLQMVQEQQQKTYDVWAKGNWQRLVQETVAEIQRGHYAKVVLAREVEVEAEKHPFSVNATLHCLRQSYPGAHVFAFQRGSRTFVGATPERLIHAHDGQLHTMALAGSAPRGGTEEEDRWLGSELLHSPKNRQEHEIVSRTIRDALSQLCARVWISDTPELLRLKNIQHLQTAIVGELLPGRSILEALRVLHPTPAVGGSPTRSALAFIRAHEHLDRGWYAGPIGWIDLQGNGEFAVALRSAVLEQRCARLFAGCGIVADSDPATEYSESCLKLQVMLRSLSGEE